MRVADRFIPVGLLAGMALAGLALAGPLGAQPAPPTVATVAAPESFREIRDVILDRVRSGEAPSMGVAVVRDGRIVWEEAFGWADVERRTPATPETVYPIGSLSKSLTAMGIMVLVERGKLELDDPVEKHLPPETITVHEGNGADLTIRRVMQMRGGIPHGWATYGDSFDPPTIGEHLRSSGIVVFPPGEVELYSNNAYGVLEAVIAAATGRDFGEFMRSEVLEPLGMRRSFATLTSDLVDCAAARYGAPGERLSHAQSHFIPQGGAGGFASVHDLALYALFHLGMPAPGQRPILADETLERMHYEKAPGSQSLIALGWGSVSLEGGLHWLISNGSIGGANSMLTLIPEEHFAVAVLTNISSSSLADETAIQIADAALPGFGAQAMRTIQTYEEANAPVPLEPGPELLGGWRGRLETEQGPVVVVLTVREGGGAAVRLGADGPVGIERLTLQDDRISGGFAARIPGHPVFGQQHAMELTLRRGDGGLYGHVTSTLDTEAGSLSIPFYLHLERLD
jgi:CubicO group peptidase (beta-lactamase class C family)